MALAYETNIAFSSTIQSQKPYNSIIINCYASADDVKSKLISENEVAVFGEYKVLVFYRQPNVSKEPSYRSFTLRKNFCEIVLVDVVDKNNITAELKLQPSCNFSYISKSRLRSFWNIEVTGEIKVCCEATNTDNKIKSSTNLNTPTVNSSNTIKSIEAINSKDSVGTINLSEIINTANNIEADKVSNNLNTESLPDNSVNEDSRNSPPIELVDTDEDETSSENVQLDSQDNDEEYSISSKVWQFEDSESTKVEDLMYMDFETLKKIDKD